MTEKLKILILGYGEMGHAMEYLLKDHHQLNIWERQPKDNSKPISLEHAVAKADIILFCLPVVAHQKIIEKIVPYLRENSLCISIAKGLDEAGQTAAQIFSDLLIQDQSYALLYGPMISEEICMDRCAFAQAAGVDGINSYNMICKLYSNTNLYIEPASDITGISWSVILKNVYALIFGMADELKLGDNMRGYLTVTALNELNQITHQLGGQTGSPYHLAGLGDLITTATSKDSHHHELGRMLAREETKGIEGEGIHTLEMVNKHKIFNTTVYPMYKLINDIVQEPRNVRDKINGFLTRIYS